MAAKWRRSLWFLPVLGVINLTFLTIQIHFNCIVHADTLSLFCLFPLLLAVAWVVVVPTAIWHRRRRLRQAEEANRPLLPS
jgi:hypothetical protein